MARIAVILRAGALAGVMIAGPLGAGASGTELPGVRLEALGQAEYGPLRGPGASVIGPARASQLWIPAEEEPRRARSLPFPSAAASGAAVLVGLWLRGAARRRRG